MTAPRFAPCKCGHPKQRHHEAFEGECIAESCRCTKYVPITRPDPAPPLRPVPAAPPATTVPADAAPTVEQLIAAGNRAGGRAARLAQRLNTLAGDLREVLLIEREREAARREVAELEQRLAKARAKLKPNKPAASTATAGENACPSCERTFATPSACGAHRAKAHGYRREAAS